MAGKFPKLEQVAALRVARATRQSSRGGVESRKRAPADDRKSAGVSSSTDDNGAGRSERKSSPPVGVASDPRDSKSRHGVKALGTRGPKPGHGGRPRIGQNGKTLKAVQPWKKLGMSQRTWYRRQAEKRAKE